MSLEIYSEATTMSQCSKIEQQKWVSPFTISPNYLLFWKHKESFITYYLADALMKYFGKKYSIKA